MTAEALSPPNPMQSLRERLIQQGSIKSDNAENISFEGNKLLIKNIKDKFFQTLQAIDHIRENFKIVNEINEILRKGIGNFSLKDFFQKSNCSYSGLLGFLNFYRVLENLINKKNKFSDVIFIIRTGFFFAFKENMRNTP